MSTSLSPLLQRYTGTESQPDNVSIFYKNGNDIQIKDEAFINEVGHHPCLFFDGIPRINAAVRRAWKEIRSGNSSELWNAFKNSVRGFVQLCPLLGCGTLRLHDYLRTHLYFHRKLKAELASQNVPIMGFAFDGKVIATFSPVHMRSERPLDVLNYVWHKQLASKIENNSPLTKRQLAERMHQYIITR